MIDFGLPALDNAVPPDFTDAAGCKHWLLTLPLANAVQSQALLLRQLGLVNRCPIPAVERLHILEILRGPAVSTQEACGHRFAGKPVPLAPAEQAGYESNQALWQTLVVGYLRCFEEAPAPAPQAALFAQRALACLAAALLDSFAATRMPPTGYWRLVYRVFSAAEEAGAAALVVEDRLRHGRIGVSPAAAFAEPALLAAAAPHELSFRQFTWVSRWVRHWAPKVGVLSQPPQEPKAVPLAAELGSDLPPAPATARAAGPAVRWLDTGELRGSIKRRLAKLAAGTPPAELDLGDDCVMPGAETVLQHVYQRWCKGGAGRRHDVRPASGACQVVVGLPASHVHIAGKAFEQPVHGTDMSRRQHDEIATFGRISTHHLAQPERPETVLVEQWRLMESGISSVQISRSLGQAGGRIGNGQLLALRGGDAGPFLLGWLRWLRIGGDDILHAGVELLAGVPEPVSTRATTPSTLGEKYRQAFLLPEVALLKQPSRIVLPLGTFRDGLGLDVRDGTVQRIRLTGLLERGADFECVAYRIAS